MPVFNNMLAGASGGAGGAGYEIERSLRFNYDDGSHLVRNFPLGNQRLFTFSAWLKLSVNEDTADNHYIFATDYNTSGSNPVIDRGFEFAYSKFSNKFELSDYGASTGPGDNSGTSAWGMGVTTAVFRDPSAWYHVVLSIDTTQSTAANRVKLYVNNQLHALSSYPAQNAYLSINQARNHYIGTHYLNGTFTRFFDGYMADVHFIDGQALAPTDFGAPDDNGVWQPKEFAGTYNNGIFYSNYGVNVNVVSNPRFWVHAFDGQTNTYLTGNGTSNDQSIWTYPTGIPITSSLRLRLGGGNSSFVYVNGTQVAGLTGTNANNPAWYTVTGVTNLTSIGIGNNGTTWSSLSQIEVDGQILTDATVGRNSFHLDFKDNSSNAALGNDAAGSNNWTVNNLTASSLNYSESTAASPSGSSGFSSAITNLFDSDDNTYATANYAAGDTTDITVTFNPAVTAGSTLTTKIYQYSTYHSLKVNSGSFVVASGGVVNLLSGHGISAGDPITSITYRTTSPTSSWNLSNQWYYIKNDGVNLQSNPSSTDCLRDTPTNGTQTDTGAGGEVVGNYCTLNPLAQLSGTLSNGNLDYNLGSGTKFVSGTIAVKSGKFYWEAKAVSGTTNGSVGGRFGFSQSSSILNGETGPFTLTWHATGGIQTFISGSYAARLTGTNYADGDTLGCALDADSNIAYFYKNGSLAYTYDFSSLVPAGSQFLTPTCWNGSSGTPVWTYNFGARAFAHSARTNHKCLCTANLEPPTIADGSLYFDTTLWSGNGSTQAISGLSFSPDLIWGKRRDSTNSHWLMDVVRGAGQRLISNETSAESDKTDIQSAFNSDGFTIGNNTESNASGGTYVSWSWDAGSSTVSNTDGTITSQVRANPSAGFSIVKYTGNNTSGATVGHGLNAAPEFAIFKQVGVSNDWSVYSKAAGATGYLRLNLTDAFTTTSGQFNNTDPSSSVITLGSDHNANGPSNEIICYAFAPVEGYSAMGGYTGNGNSDGVFVYTGFTPRWLLFKRHDAGSDWTIYDTARDPHNVSGIRLRPNLSNADHDERPTLDILSNGFKFRRNSYENGGNDQYLYMAFAEHPFKTARAR